MSSEHTDQDDSVDALPTGRPKPPPERKFHCTFDPNCKSRFSRSEHLQRHIRKHTGERPFKCDCGRTFSRMDNLRQHAQTVHAGDESNLAAWPSTKIVPVTPVAPLPADVRALSRQTSIAAIQAAAEAVAVSEVTAARKAAQLQAAAERANASAAKKAEAKAKRTAAEARAEAGSDPALGSFKRPAPATFSREEDGVRSASGRAKRTTTSARQAASTARIVSVMPTSRFAIRPPSRKPRERNYDSFSSNLSLNRPSILHHLDETAAGGTYGKRRSMGQPPSAQAEASVTEPIVLPPFHSVRGPELQPIVSFDRFTARLGDHDSTATSHVRGNALSQESFLRSTSSKTSTDALSNARDGPSRSQPGSRESMQQHHKARKLSIASLCSAEDSGSSSEAVVAEEASGDRPPGLAMPDLRNVYRQRQVTTAAAAQTDMAAAIHATTV